MTAAQTSPIPADVQAEPRNLPDLALILPPPGTASVAKYGGIVTRDPYDSVDCRRCGDPVYARATVLTGIKVSNVIPVDEHGHCPRCAWIADAQTGDASPEAIVDRIVTEVELVGQRLGAVRRIIREDYGVPAWYGEENHDELDEVA